MKGDDVYLAIVVFADEPELIGLYSTKEAAQKRLENRGGIVGDERIRKCTVGQHLAGL